MIDKELKNKALKLRRDGFSYSDIVKEIKVSKGTLWYWFSKYEWSQEVRLKNSEKTKAEATKRLLKYVDERRVQLSLLYENAKLEAEKEMIIFRYDPVFIAALMLYLGEGDKSSKGHSLRIGNIDPAVLNIFIKFLSQFCKVDSFKIKFWLLCYPDHNVELCENWWSERLSISKDHFYKTQIIQGRHKSKKLPYGVGNITIGGKRLKVKVLHWIVLVCQELLRV